MQMQTRPAVQEWLAGRREKHPCHLRRKKKTRGFVASEAEEKPWRRMNLMSDQE